MLHYILRQNYSKELVSSVLGIQKGGRKDASGSISGTFYHYHINHIFSLINSVIYTIDAACQTQFLGPFPISTKIPNFLPRREKTNILDDWKWCKNRKSLYQRASLPHLDENVLGNPPGSQRYPMLEEQLVHLFVSAMTEEEVDEVDASDDCEALWRNLSSELIFFVLFQYITFPTLVTSITEKLRKLKEVPIPVYR